MAARVFNARLAAQTVLIKKQKLYAKLKGISDRVTKSKTKHLFVENELKKIKTLDLSWFLGKNYFEGSDGAQNALVLQTMQKLFNLSNANQISKWKSKGLSNQYLNLVGTLGDIILSQSIKPMHVIFSGKGLLYQKNNDATTGGPIINIYTVYKVTSKTISSDFVLKNCFFGGVKITNTYDSDPDKWKYSYYGIGFYTAGSFTHPDDGKDAKNVIVLDA